MQEMTTITDKGDTIECTLRLEEIGQLFTAPEFDPFTPQARVSSGVEDIVSHLRTRRLRPLPKIKTTVVVPPDRFTPQIEEESRAALMRFCAHELEQNRRDMAASRFEGFSKLPIGFIVVAGMILFLVLLAWVLPDLVTGLAFVLTPVASVITWVAIWNPSEVLIYDRWANRRSVQIYTAIQKMDLYVQAA